jgi:hypothetical protein
MWDEKQLIMDENFINQSAFHLWRLTLLPTKLEAPFYYAKNSLAMIIESDFPSSGYAGESAFQ